MKLDQRVLLTLILGKDACINEAIAFMEANEFTINIPENKNEKLSKALDKLAKYDDLVKNWPQVNIAKCPIINKDGNTAFIERTTRKNDTERTNNTTLVIIETIESKNENNKNIVYQPIRKTHLISKGKVKSLIYNGKGLFLTEVDEAKQTITVSWYDHVSVYHMDKDIEFIFTIFCKHNGALAIEPEAIIPDSIEKSDVTYYDEDEKIKRTMGECLKMINEKVTTFGDKVKQK